MLRKVLEISLGISIAVLPWSIKLNSILIIFIFTICFIDLIVKKELFALPLIREKYLIIIYCVFILSLLWSTDYKEALNKLVSSISFVVIPFIFIYSRKYHKLNVKIIYFFFTISVLVFFITFLVNLLDFHPEAILSKSYWKTVFVRCNQLFSERGMHPTYFSLFLGISLYICIETILKNKNWIRVMGLIVSVFLITAITMLMAKMVIISLILSILLIIIIRLFKDYKSKNLAYYTTGLVLVGILTSLGLKKLPNTFVQDYNNYKNLLLDKEISDSYDYSKYGKSSETDTWLRSNRIFIWKTSIEVWKENWILGTGIGDYKIDMKKKYKENNYTYLAEAKANTHNQFLSYLVQFGLFGFFIFYCFIKIVINTYHESSNLYLGLVFFMFCSFLTENILERQWGIISVLFFLSLIKYKSKNINLITNV